MISYIDRLKSSTVIVEGKRDRESLLKFGINAITFNNAVNKPSSIKGNVIILTDLDEDGDRIASFFESFLSQHDGINNIDTQFRKKFLFLFNTRRVENVFNAYKKEVELWQKHI